MALDRLPQIAITSYNSYRFGPTVQTTGYEVTALYDSSGRTVWACEFTVTLHWHIESPDGQATTLQEAEELTGLLMRPAGVLEYIGRGFGEPFVNQGRVRDVNWGPKPVSIKFDQPNNGLVSGVSWTVKFTLPTCDDAVYKGVREFCFTVDYERDNLGYTTRTYNATVKIAQTRQNVRDRTLSETADSYFEQVLPAPTPGFRPTSITRRLSEDKCALTVTVVEVQMPPTMPPAGVIQVQAEHTYNAKGLAQWTGTVSGTYDVTRNTNATFAVAAYMALLEERLRLARKMIIGNGLPVGGEARRAFAADIGKPVAVIPVSATATESDIYGRTQARFSVTYTVAGIGFSEVFANGGLWQPAPVGATTSTWKDWFTSAGISEALSGRGHARLVFRPNDDKIVDLCAAVPPQPPQPTQPASFVPQAPALTVLRDALGKAFPVPGAESSWLHYECAVVIHPKLGRVIGSTLPKAPISTGSKSQVAAFDALAPTAGARASGDSPFPPLADLLRAGIEAGETFVQQRTKPSLYVTLYGQALRCGYEIPVPELVEVNGARPVLVGAPMFAQRVVASAFIPIVRADWMLTYFFTDDGRTLTGSIGVPPSFR